MKFKFNDIVKTKTGNHYKVICSDEWRTSAKPVDHSMGLKRSKSDATQHDMSTDNLTYVGNYDKIMKEKEMAKLYEVKDLDGNTVYGTKLAVNSEGLWVIEVKGGGVVTAKKEDCQEVIPHSILVSFHYSKQKTNMMADKGKYEEGSFYFVSNKDGFAIAKVEKVDTKTPTYQTFKPFAKVNVEMIED